MQKKLAFSFALTSALLGALVTPTLAAEELRSAAHFPVKLAGCGLGTVLGVPLGSAKDSVKGGQSAAKYVARTLGNEDGDFQMLAGYLVGAPFGVVGGAAYVSVDGMVHGFKTGYDRPFSKDAFTFKDE